VNQEESEHHAVDGMKKGVDSTGYRIYLSIYRIVWYQIIKIVTKKQLQLRAVIVYNVVQKSNF